METQYKIIGGDGIEYGPISLDELRSWIGDGRVAGPTQVWRSDMSIWSTADRFQELHEALARLYALASATAMSTARAVGFWTRVAAYLIDQILLIPLCVFLWFPVSNAMQWPQMPPERPAKFTDANRPAYAADATVWMDHFALLYLPIYLIYEVARKWNVWRYDVRKTGDWRANPDAGRAKADLQPGVRAMVGGAIEPVYFVWRLSNCGAAGG